MLMSQDGTVIRVPVESVRCMGRNTMGVRVMNLRGADKVSGMARLVGGGGGNGVEGTGVEGGDAVAPSTGLADADDFDLSLEGDMDAEVDEDLMEDEGDLM
jgi:DNA gyrase/topoisomerase IV subunit A